VMTLTSTAFPDGGLIPVKYTQAGDQASPSLSWSAVPEGTASFVLIVHDIDAATPNGTDDILHWMLWNIPATVTSLPERVPSMSQLPDGTRQISATGPYYRGPGAPAAGPAHHYVFELFALDAMVDVPAVGAAPPQTRAAVVAAMAGHVRGKAACVGLFKRKE
jgi:Raf kinase inhibitor-like YbhB/YbcL family protein